MNDHASLQITDARWEAKVARAKRYQATRRRHQEQAQADASELIHLLKRSALARLAR